MADPARFDITIKPVAQADTPGDPWGVKNVAPATAAQDWSVKSVQPVQQAVPKSDPWYVKAISPITNYWPTQQKNAAESFGEMKKGVEELGTPGERLTGVMHTGLGAVGYVASPINSAIESVAGKPIEDVSGIPKEYTDFAIGLGLPGIGLARAPKVVQKMLAPEQIGKGADAAATIRTGTGRAARDIMTAEGNLAPYEKAVLSMPEAQQWNLAKYIDGSPSAVAPTTPQFRAFADAFKGEMKDLRAQIEAMPEHDQMTFYEEFFPHMWKDPNAASNVVRGGGLGAVKQGSGASTKARTKFTLDEGEAAGLEPVTRNPVEIGVRYINSMRKYIASKEIIRAGEDEGHIIYRTPKSVGASGNVVGPKGIPEGYAKLEGRASSSPKGDAYAPEDWARVYNNFISRGFEQVGGGEYGQAYNAARRAANAVTQTVLSFSGYHAFTMAEATMSNQMAKAVFELRHGRPGSALKEFGKSAIAPYKYATRGKSFSDMYLGKAMPVSPQDKEIIDLITDAGGRLAGMKHALDYDSSALGDYLSSFRRGRLRMEAVAQKNDILAHPVGGTARTIASNIGRIMDTFNKPIFQHYIPSVKAAATHENLGQWLKQNPNATQAEKLQAARQAVDRVDGRFGEMIHDNIFWHKILKQTAMLSLLSYSWKKGAVQEIGGGVREVARAAMGKSEWGAKSDYLVGMSINWAIMSAAYQYMKTGEAPRDLHDLIAPRTGGVDERTGEPERIIPPGQMKELLAFAQGQGGQQVMNALNPGLRAFGQSLSILGGQGGSDWRGLPILSPREEGQPVLDKSAEWLSEYFKFVAGSMTPIQGQQLGRGPEEGSAMNSLELGLGIRKAPRHLIAPDETDEMMKRIWGKKWKQKTRADEKEKSRYGGPTNAD